VREPESRPDTPAAGNALLWLTGSLVAFAAFLVGVPGQQRAGRTWLWVGVVLLVLGGTAFAAALRSRLRYLRTHRPRA
jgi:hypothetical protein